MRSHVNRNSTLLDPRKDSLRLRSQFCPFIHECLSLLLIPIPLNHKNIMRQPLNSLLNLIKVNPKPASLSRELHSLLIQKIGQRNRQSNPMSLINPKTNYISPLQPVGIPVRKMPARKVTQNSFVDTS